MDVSLGEAVLGHRLISPDRAGAVSAAGERATRPAAMRAGERNIDEPLDEMNGAHRHRRQALITEALLGDVAGFDAPTAGG
ncbi:MAG: hypothetical protein ACLFTG_03230 [Alphaproteobacteria bacterium]